MNGIVDGIAIKNIGKKVLSSIPLVGTILK